MKTGPPTLFLFLASDENTEKPWLNKPGLPHRRHNMEDLNARTESVIGGSTDEGETRVDPDQDDVQDPSKEEVVVGDPEVDDEPEELDEGVSDDPEYEPLEPDDPE